MPKFEGICRVCLSKPATEPEHVWPAGYLKRLDEAAVPPSAWTRNGNPLIKANGRAFEAQGGRQRMFLSVCRSCNDEMNRIIEAPAQSIVIDQTLARWTKPLDADAWKAVGLWWAKVLFMQGHEDLRPADKGLASADPFRNVRFNGTMPDLSWLAIEAPAPRHASLFMFHADTETEPRTEHRLVFPESVLMSDDSIAQCHHLNLATSELGLLAVWHPGLTVDHPMVRSGEAWELLHSPPNGPVALISLPRVSHHRVAVSAGRGQVREGHQVDGSQISNLLAEFGNGDESPVLFQEEQDDGS